jgi:Tesmin/TSO1-like CXC domain, cysteine-rich domain
MIASSTPKKSQVHRSSSSDLRLHGNAPIQRVNFGVMGYENNQLSTQPQAGKKIPSSIQKASALSRERTIISGDISELDIQTLSSARTSSCLLSPRQGPETNEKKTTISSYQLEKQINEQNISHKRAPSSWHQWMDNRPGMESWRRHFRLPVKNHGTAAMSLTNAISTGGVWRQNTPRELTSTRYIPPSKVSHQRFINHHAVPCILHRVPRRLQHQTEWKPERPTESRIVAHHDYRPIVSNHQYSSGSGYQPRATIHPSSEETGLRWMRAAPAPISHRPNPQLERRPKPKPDPSTASANTVAVTEVKAIIPSDLSQPTPVSKRSLSPSPPDEVAKEQVGIIKKAKGFDKLDLLCSATLDMGELYDNPAGCSCPKSKCIALYCDCFKAGRRCNPDKCRCADCKNTVLESGANGARTKAIRSILGKFDSIFKNFL